MQIACVVFALISASGDLPSWTFDQAGESLGWTPNNHLAQVLVHDGVLEAEAVDHDPFFTSPPLEVATTPWQYLVVRLRASAPGSGELFWTGDTQGQYGGFTQEKATRFTVGAGDWQEVVIFPFWHAEGTLRRLRLDLYNGARFEIDSIAIQSWGDAENIPAATPDWAFAGDVSRWRVHASATDLWAPPINLDVSNRDWISVALRSDREGEALILWATAGAPGLQSEGFSILGDGHSRHHNIEMTGVRAWRDLVAFGLRLPEGVYLDAVSIGPEPKGPAELRVNYFGFENGVNRAARQEHILAQLENFGGAAAVPSEARLEVDTGLELLVDATQSSPTLEMAEQANLTWAVKAAAPGEYGLRLLIDGELVAKTALHFEPAVDAPRADYVPTPRPVRTSVDVFAYYFPGWEAPAKWDCIRGVAPIRKPLLGYYDEANPEVVDWQIKWSVENGIKGYLVDWYWIQGAQHLTHWFEAYRKARYRDYLEVAIMWANHNPPGTHSRDDWRAVTLEWIDRYFNLPTYQKIDGKPAVFIWDPRNVRNDLGGSEAVKEALDESQAMAREAGYEGISFVAMGYGFGKSDMERMHDEGYSGWTTYHEWGAIPHGIQRAGFDEVVETSPEAWRAHEAGAAPLEYYPVVDTGWDSRPWHGAKSFVIEGRTPALFEKLLRSAREFVSESDKDFLILAPMNEWGEGSYIEPNTEFDFKIIEAIRTVFTEDPPESWPQNLSPEDLGLGPYDFPPRPSVTEWRGEGWPGGWRPMMNVGDFRVEQGALHMRSMGQDPALVVDLVDVRADAFSKAELVMRIDGAAYERGSCQLFWSVGGSATSEAASVVMPLSTRGQQATYVFDLAGNSRWRGRISSLRLDPCDVAGAELTLESFKLVP